MCRTLAPWVGGPGGNGPSATCPPCGSCTPVVSSLQGGGRGSHSARKAFWFQLCCAAFRMCVGTLVARCSKLSEHTCKTFLNSAYLLPAVDWGLCARTGCGPGLFQLEYRPTVVVCTKDYNVQTSRNIGVFCIHSLLESLPRTADAKPTAPSDESHVIVVICWNIVGGIVIHCRDVIVTC